MPTVIACYKWVVDEADIKTNADLSIDCSKAKWKISDYDKNAIEAAVRTAHNIGAKAVALTFGPSQAKTSLKDALSRGPEEVYWVNSQLAEAADGFVTSRVLAAAVKQIAEASLVICAEGSSDVYARQTAPRLAATLDWPVVTSVTALSIEGNVLTAVRSLKNCTETVQVELPAVVSVLPEINPAPIPSLKSIVSASKKPVVEFSAEQLDVADIKAKTQVQSMKAYVMKRKNIIIAEGDSSSKIRELVASLKKEGVL